MSGPADESISPERLAWFARRLNRPGGRPEVLLADRIESGDLDPRERAALAQLVLLVVAASRRPRSAVIDERTWGAMAWQPVERHLWDTLLRAEP